MKKLFSDLVRVLSMQFIVLLLIIGLFIIGFSFRKDILISYHKWGEQAAYDAYKKLSAKTRGEEAQPYIENAHRHQDALVELGYLEERTFDTKYLTVYTPEFKKMLEEFIERHPHCSYSVGDRGKNKISITCRKEWMPLMEELFKKYDVPPDDPNQMLTSEK
jgi:hypothetical protein